VDQAVAADHHNAVDGGDIKLLDVVDGKAAVLCGLDGVLEVGQLEDGLHHVVD
jgi:hypothetical protein